MIFRLSQLEDSDDKKSRILGPIKNTLLLMAEILHQLRLVVYQFISFSHYLQGFIHPKWLGMGFLNHQQ